VDEKSVAVLAFANLSDDKANEYFSDGISEELLNVLGKVPGLKVSARTSAFYFKGKEVPIPEIARQLGVAYVVEGSVRKAGDKVRITAQLIKAADGFHVWSDTFTRDLKDIFAVQDEIAGLIAQQMKVTLGAVRVAHEVNPEAHRLVLEGRHFWNMRSELGFDEAEVRFRRAILLDPDYAAAHAGLANVLATRIGYRAYEGETGRSYATVREAAERAIALDPNDAGSYPALALALTFEGRLAEGDEVFHKAMELNPSYALPHHWRSIALELAGRLDEALLEIGRAVELDPLSGIALITRARMLYEAGRYAEGLDNFDRAGSFIADRPATKAGRAICLLKLNRRDEAADCARQVLTAPDHLLRLTADADAIYVLRQLGLEPEANERAVEALQRLGADSYQRGAVLAALGRWQEARPYLGRTPMDTQYVFYWIPTWDAWRSDPRFGDLMKSLKCEKQYEVARTTLVTLQTGSSKR
jgi:TolB-like protein/Tfp pilus assembly protein PilF